MSSYKPNPQLAQRLRRLLDEDGLSPTEFGHQHGIGTHTVCDWVRRRCRPSAENMQRLLKIFGERGRVLLAEELATKEPPPTENKPERPHRVAPIKRPDNLPTDTAPGWMRRMREAWGLTLAEMAARCDTPHGRLECKATDKRYGVISEPGIYHCSGTLLRLLEDGGVTTAAWAAEIASAYGMTAEQRREITAAGLRGKSA